jgi:hypothetical protein
MRTRKQKKKTRTIIWCERFVVEYGTTYLEIVIPSWNLKKRIKVPATKFPREVLQAAALYPDNKLRFYAHVNLKASRIRDLKVSDITNLDLLDIFQPEPSLQAV